MSIYPYGDIWSICVCIVTQNIEQCGLRRLVLFIYLLFYLVAIKAVTLICGNGLDCNQ